MKRLVSFDFDGTIREDLYDRINSHEHKVGFFKGYIGKSNPTNAEIRHARKGMSNDQRDVYRDRLYAMMLEKSSVPEQVRLKLDELRDDPNTSLVMITVAKRWYVNAHLEKHGLQDHFEKIYSMRDDYDLSMKPDWVFESVAKEFGLDPNNCTHIGDNYTCDYLAPKMAGWNAILLSHADVRTHSPEDLDSLI